MPETGDPGHRRQRSLHNQTGDKPIHPTPIVAVIGRHPQVLPFENEKALAALISAGASEA